jgi:uncharacterized protein YcaQ
LPTIALRHLRAHAIERSLFAPTTLARAIERLGFVQADPIRAPARAQDLVLRHRARGYCVGDLERRYAALALEEDLFVNYGYLPRAHLSLMHPRTPRAAWNRATKQRAEKVLAFVRERGEVHPREVEERFAHGTVTNYWGGRSNATTHLLEAMHYRGMLRVARRDAGIRVYAPALAIAPHGGDPEERAEALLRLALLKYAPTTSVGLSHLARKLRWAAPQLAKQLMTARERLPRARVDGVTWYWPEGEDPTRAEEPPPRVLFLAPFDPLVWDRERFEHFWGWTYRFEAYTPVKKRKLGYYALPLLWRSRIIGWANLTQDGSATLGYVEGRAPRDRAFSRALEAELAQFRLFLGV